MTPSTSPTDPNARQTSNRVLDVFLSLEMKAADGVVSLVDLRPAAGLPRAEFDAQLMALRRTGPLHLAGLTEMAVVTLEKIQAAVYEQGAYWLYVSRHRPWTRPTAPTPTPASPVPTPEDAPMFPADRAAKDAAFCAPMTIEYDSRGGNRVRKTFPNAFTAKAFYALKAKAGRNPRIVPAAK